MKVLSITDSFAEIDLVSICYYECSEWSGHNWFLYTNCDVIDDIKRVLSKFGVVERAVVTYFYKNPENGMIYTYNFDNDFQIYKIRVYIN